MNGLCKIILLSSGPISIFGFVYWYWCCASTNSTNICRYGNKQKKQKRRVPGLYNLGNTCFMNVILQCFAGQKSFVKWLQNICEMSQFAGTKNELIAHSLNELMEILCGASDQTCIDPSYLLSDLTARGWQIPYDEHDAHEFFHCIISTLDGELKYKKDFSLNSFSNSNERNHHVIHRYEKNEITCEKTCSFDKLNMLPVHHTNDHVYHGTLSVRLSCSSCGHRNPITYDSFDSLSLPIVSSHQTSKITLNDCIRSYFASELLSNVHCKNCTRIAWETMNSAGDEKEKIKVEGSTSVSNKFCCMINHIGGKSDFMKQIDFLPLTITSYSDKSLKKSQTCNASVKTETFETIKSSFYKVCRFSKLPNCLCIHLQRLVWKYGMPMKLQCFVEYPEILDLGPFTHGYNVNHSAMRKIFSVFNPLLGANIRSQGIAHAATNASDSLAYGLKGGSSLVSKFHKRHCLYQLTGLVVHLGDWNCSGHFVAYRRVVTEYVDGKRLTKWFYTSDHFVREVNVAEVLANPAYILFYEKI